MTGIAPTKTITYGYSEGSWHDLLTSYNGQAITYDAIGNPTTYRGYYYDTETGFYYVSSRYYDPEIGWWINADDFLFGPLGAGVGEGLIMIFG